MDIQNGKAGPIEPNDEELIDTLIAISVVAKRLAVKLRQEVENPNESEENTNERER